MMTTADIQQSAVPQRPQRKGSWVMGLFQCVLDLALVLWVARAALISVSIGFLLIALTPQAQDLLIPLADHESPWQGIEWPWTIVIFFALLFLFWAMPTHYSARLALDDDARLQLYAKHRSSSCLNRGILWIPRLLGAATYVAILVGSYRALENLPIISDPYVIPAIEHNLRWFAVWDVAALILFVIYTLARPAIANSAVVGWAERSLAFARPLLRPFEIADSKAAVRLGGPTESILGRVLFIGLFAIFVLALIGRPSRVAELLPRAFAIALVLGGWLPILTYLSVIGRRIRVPLIGLVGLGLAAISAISDHHYDVRKVAAPQGNPAAQKLRLGDALTLWMRENRCEQNEAACPRPIIVTGSGGGSRAGFFLVSVIGELLDRAGEHQLDASAIRNRLFAISGVSGSSVGAVMTVAALASGGPGTQFPCAPKGFDQWYGEKVENWRGCLEVLMSGDFLTPVFIGLTFHDVVGLHPKYDRAVMLEEAWERRFETATLEGAGHGNPLPCPARLDCPFMTLRPVPGLWVPLLLLNGVSVGTGHRILTTILDTDRDGKCPPDPAPDGCPLFTEKTDFHKLLMDTAQPPSFAGIRQMLAGVESPGQQQSDISLSTAAANSARFPLISPPGGIRNGQGALVDRIVDGGYFEDYGALTAMELIEAIHLTRPGLDPFVLVVTNDPEVPLDLPARPVDVSATQVLTDLTAPLTAVANTRQARGTLSVQQMRALLGDIRAGCNGPSTAHIRVWPQFENAPAPTCQDLKSKVPLRDKTRAVSLSWWLSRPVQFHLFDQLTPKSCNSDALPQMWEALTSPPHCPAPSPQ